MLFIVCNALQFLFNNAGFLTWRKIFMAATFSPHEYFPSRWKTCSYCTKIAARSMQQIAYETTALGLSGVEPLSSYDQAHGAPWCQLCENLTSSTKPEVHDASQRWYRRLERRSTATCTKQVKFGRVVSEICERTDRQTNRQTVKWQQITSWYFRLPRYFSRDSAQH